jgi:demethylmenaquinone methyltransferase/2-methoxy-6-polyprenyl-1,4-benzoquinol methylase
LRFDISSPGFVLKENAEHKVNIKRMFNAIAPRYDLINHLLSCGVDIYWRKKAISKLNVSENSLVLDLACGSADFTIETIIEKKCSVIGVDFAQQMLICAKRKIKKKKLNSFWLLNGDGEQLPFVSRAFDGVTSAFGIRNMASIETALGEMHRILKENGQALILEFSLPAFKPFRKLYLFYFNNILPIIGKILSKDKNAYSYLPASVKKFPAVDEFVIWMKEAGFRDIQYWKLLNGIAVIYKGIKD